MPVKAFLVHFPIFEPNKTGKLMLVHIVSWRVNDIPGKRKEEVIKQVKDTLEALPAKIDEIIDYEVGVNISSSPKAFDVILYSTFADEAALDRYRVHPEHKKVIELFKELMRETMVVDYFRN